MYNTEASRLVDKEYEKTVTSILFKRKREKGGRRREERTLSNSILRFQFGALYL
jgi:hypothetical protein